MATFNSNGTDSNIQTLINGANNGDIITIPAGSFTWNSGINNNGKAIKITGSGTANTGGATPSNITTVITLNGGIGLTPPTSGQLEICFLRITAGTTGYPIGASPKTTGPLVAMSQAGTVLGVSTPPWAFHDISISSNQQVNSQFLISQNGGVIWNCTFNSNSTPNATGQASDDELLQFKYPGQDRWKSNATIGASGDPNGTQNTYVENNTFLNNFRQGLDIDDGARVVIRNNTFTNCAIATHGYDTSPWGNRHWELYNNTFTLNPPLTGNVNTDINIGNGWFCPRGGTGIVSGNTFNNCSGSSWGQKNSVTFLTDGATQQKSGKCYTTYPIPRADGAGWNGGSTTYPQAPELGSGYDVEPIYVWNNTGTNPNLFGWNTSNDCPSQPNDSSFYIRQNRDFFTTAPPGTGTPGTTATWSAFTFPHPLVAALSGGPGPIPTPVLVQHFNTASNNNAPDASLGTGNPGNPFKFSFPNPALANNCLILEISNPFSAGRSIAITDNIGTNTWTLAKTINNGSQMTSVYFCLNAKVNTQNITVTFDTTLYNVHFSGSEFYNVATASALTGTASATTSGATVATPAISGSVTGNLIWMCGFDTANANGSTTQITKITAGTGFTLLAADIMLGTFQAYGIQAASIIPSATLTGGTDTFNVIAISLSTATAGTVTPSGIRIVHIQHVAYNRAIPVQFPSTGNLLYVATAFPTAFEGATMNTYSITSPSGTPSNSWVATSQAPIVSGITPPQTFYAANANTSPNLTLQVNGAGPGNKLTSFVMYDIQGAATAPFDKFATGVNGNVDAGGIGRTVAFNLLTISPSTANGLIIATLPLSNGAIQGPSGNGTILNTMTYGNVNADNGADLFDNVDGYGHFYNSTTNSYTFGWTFLEGATGSTVVFGIAVAFSATGGGSNPIFVNATVIIK